jgi:EAL domain-containing protein (putative c-di-GMP-specific phosphodiesterase class I)
MFRLAVAGAALAVLCVAAAYLLPWRVAAGYFALLAPLVALLALFSALVAAVVARRALRQAASLRAELLVLARSVDIALREVVMRTGEETATVGDVANSVAREVAFLSERLATDPGDTADGQAAGNVVPHPSAERVHVTQGAPPPAAPDQGAIEAAYQAAIAAGTLDIALQPIVSVRNNAAAGFEVFANLPLDGGQRVELRRPAGPASPADAARFERILLATALKAGRRQLGAASIDMPLHVAVSDAILADGGEFSAVLDMLQFYPDLARSFVLSLPAALAGQSGEHRQALDILAARGVRFAAEGWDETIDGERPAHAGLAFLKLSADRLLDREKGRRRLAPAVAVIQRAAAGKLAIIATEVATDDDAVSLIDIGIDLMAGPRFGGPRRLKPEGSDRPGRLALV